MAAAAALTVLRNVVGDGPSDEFLSDLLRKHAFDAAAAANAALRLRAKSGYP